MKHKVLLVLLLGIIISVSASAQKVTMNLKQVKLEKVFSAITPVSYTHLTLPTT